MAGNVCVEKRCHYWLTRLLPSLAVTPDSLARGAVFGVLLIVFLCSFSVVLVLCFASSLLYPVLVCGLNFSIQPARELRSPKPF